MPYYSMLYKYKMSFPYDVKAKKPQKKMLGVKPRVVAMI